MKLVDKFGQQGLALLATRWQACNITGLLEQAAQFDARIVGARIPYEKWNIKTQSLGEQNQWGPLIIAHSDSSYVFVANVRHRFEANEVINLIRHYPIRRLLLQVVQVVRWQSESCVFGWDFGQIGCGFVSGLSCALVYGIQLGLPSIGQLWCYFQWPAACDSLRALHPLVQVEIASNWEHFCQLAD